MTPDVSSTIVANAAIDGPEDGLLDAPEAGAPETDAPEAGAPETGAPGTGSIDETGAATKRRFPRWAQAVAAVVLGVVVMWVLSAIALVIYTDGARSPELHVLEIPPGTAELVEAGENPLEIPSTWAFLADDTLRLVNDDDVQHWIGNFHVPPNETVEYTLGTTIGGSLFCTIHPDEAIVIDVEARTFDWRLTLFPTFVLGPLIGLILFGVGWAMAHLDEPQTPSPGTRRSPQPSGKEPHHDR